MQINARRFFGEPIIQFLILGGLLFLLVTYVQQKKSRTSREINVDSERVGLMLLNYKTQTGILPTKAQLEAMIDNYIREEISYREAMKMGLDKDDEIIRRRLSQKFDFLQTDLTEIPSPSDADLQKFYKDHPALFSTDVSVSFSHVYFNADNGADSSAKVKALNVLQQLKQSSLQRAPEKGDRFSLQYDYTQQSHLDVEQNFGNRELTTELFKAPLKQWVGPFQSGYGWHLVYISNRTSITEMPFAQAKEDVKSKWIAAAKAAQNKKAFDRISEKYIINRTYLETK
jgi:peptidyl-prolyl cis-trans isomerase C